jgi:hypothetical protein
VVLAFFVFIIAGALTAPFAMMGAMAGGGSLSAPGQLSGAIRLPGGSVDLGKLQAATQQAEQQIHDSQQAAANGKINAVDPNVLKGLLPDNVAGAPRKRPSDHREVRQPGQKRRVQRHGRQPLLDQRRWQRCVDGPTEGCGRVGRTRPARGARPRLKLRRSRNNGSQAWVS